MTGSIPAGPGCPTPKTRVLLPSEQRSRLAAWAASGYPREACGLLIGRRFEEVARVVRVTEARNLRRDRPVDRYELAPEDFLAEERRARSEGVEVLGFWHSHPDHPARPSSADLDAAWRGYLYLIVSTNAEGAGELRCWELEEGGFVERSLGDVRSGRPGLLDSSQVAAP